MKSILVIVALVCSSLPALAQQKVSIKVSNENVKLIVGQNVDVGDEPNHIVRVFNAQYMFPNNVAPISGLRLVEAFGRGTADLTNLSGPGQGYLMFVAENGDKFFARGNSLSQNRNVTWIAHITGGIGKLAGIQGTTQLVINVDPLSNVGTNTQFDIEYSIGK
jgi:hypothetical protein